MERFHQIDGLRGVAIILVVLLHCVVEQLSNFFKQPEFSGAVIVTKHFFGSGVDLFFVISGIVLLRPYVRGQRAFDPKKYALRRLQRLWPPYLAALLLTGLLMLAAASIPSWFSRGTFVPFDLWIFLKQIFIINFLAPFYNITWWSLNVEIVFYLTVPLIIILMKLIRKEFTCYIILFLLMLLAEYIHSLNLVSIGPGITWQTLILLFFIYLPCFFFGVLLARMDLPGRLGYFLIIAGLSYILLAEYFHLNYHNGYGIFYFGLTIAAFDRHSLPYKFLTSYPMIWMGERSYSLFLIHLTAYYLVNYLLSFLSGFNIFYYLLNSCLSLITAFLLAMTIFYLVERRFARGLVTAQTFGFAPPGPPVLVAENVPH